MNATHDTDARQPRAPHTQGALVQGKVGPHPGAAKGALALFCLPYGHLGPLQDCGGGGGASCKKKEIKY